MASSSLWLPRETLQTIRFFPPRSPRISRGRAPISAVIVNEYEILSSFTDIVRFHHENVRPPFFFSAHTDIMMMTNYNITRTRVFGIPIYIYKKVRAHTRSERLIKIRVVAAFYFF